MSMLVAILFMGVPLTTAAVDIRPESLREKGIAPESITGKVSVAEMVQEQRRRRIREIIAFSKMQLDEKNVWIIDGVQGQGAMPEEYYRKTISQLLELDPTPSEIGKDLRKGDAIFHFRSSGGDEGYLLVRDRQVVAVSWVAIH